MLMLALASPRILVDLASLTSICDAVRQGLYIYTDATAVCAKLFKPTHGLKVTDRREPRKVNLLATTLCRVALFNPFVHARRSCVLPVDL